MLPQALSMAKLELDSTVIKAKRKKLKSYKTYRVNTHVILLRHYQCLLVHFLFGISPKLEMTQGLS